MPVTQDAGAPSRSMGTCLPVAWSLGLFSSFGSGPTFGATGSWRTGRALGGMSPCSPSRRCRSMASVSDEYHPVVVGAAVVGDHVLRLLFSDGTVGDVDFSTQRWTGVLEPLSDPAFFARVAVDNDAR